MKKDQMTEVKDRVVKAAVRLPRLGGQGVLIRGGLIITAAHCVNYSCEGGMALSDYFTRPAATPAEPAPLNDSHA